MRMKVFIFWIASLSLAMTHVACVIARPDRAEAIQKWVFSKIKKFLKTYCDLFDKIN